jgi:polyribonucleotide nucleotidyltransferase
MNKELSEARDDVSQFAPRYTTMKVDQSKIAEVIGKGGAVIKSIVEQTGAGHRYK